MLPAKSDWYNFLNVLSVSNSQNFAFTSQFRTYNSKGTNILLEVLLTASKRSRNLQMVHTGKSIMVSVSTSHIKKKKNQVMVVWINIHIFYACYLHFQRQFSDYPLLIMHVQIVFSEKNNSNCIPDIIQKSKSG